MSATALHDITPLVDPALRDALASFPAILDPAADPPAARAQLLQRFAEYRGAREPAEDVRTRDAAAPGLDARLDVRVRVYEPAVRSGVLPAVVWAHGGGFVMGTVEADDGDCERLVRAVGAVVVSVDYRLAPEDPFPAGTDDVYAALLWVSRRADELGVDPERIAIAGRSSGGGTVAGVALMARDRGEVRLCFQQPLYGCFDERVTTVSAHTVADPRTWNARLMVSAWRAYLGTEAPRSGVSPYASPARAERLDGLAPAYLQVGSVDMLRDENVEYARRLMQAGVPTELHVIAGGFHGFDVLVPGAPVSRRAVAEQEAALRRALHPGT